MNQLTPADKIKVALDWVAKIEPIAIPTVLTRWSVRPDTLVKTMATDGRSMIYNPEFVTKISLSATKAIVLHEVGHVLSNHQHRRGTRNPKGFNIAADLALNDMLRRGYIAAFDGDHQRLISEMINPASISNGCFVGHGPFAKLPKNLSAEEYYDLLKAQNPPPQPPPDVPINVGPVDFDEDGESCEGGDPSDQQGDSPSDSSDEGEDQDGDDDDDNGSGSGEGSDSDEDGEDSDKDGSGSDKDGEESDSEGEDSDNGGSGSDKDSEESDSESESSLDGSDFEDSDDSGSDAGVGQGKGSEDHDPFKDLPDPSETFGSIEDAPEESLLREDEARLVLEALLGGPTYSPTGLGDIISQHNQRIQGDPEVAAQVNWRKELERFIRVQHASGWKYDRPSRRHSHRKDLVLPARRARSKTTGVVIVDTSASMSDHDCNQALDHTGKVLALFPQSTVTLVHCDTAVRSSQQFKASDFPLTNFRGWAGRGSTDLDPALGWVKQRRSQFDWLIIVTDMEWPWYNAPDPGIPTLWVNTRLRVPYHFGNEGYVLPFGKLVNLHATDLALAA